jgi:hypothetical protein
MVTVHGRYAQFRFYRPGAGNVQVVGDFDGRRVSRLRMLPTHRGEWIAVTKLAAGSYRFQYYADGEWFTDSAVLGVESASPGVIQIQPDDEVGAA